MLTVNDQLMTMKPVALVLLATLGSSLALTCPARMQIGVCSTGNDLALVDAHTETACCAACAAYNGCVLFNMKETNRSRPCALKGPAVHSFRGPCNTSGTLKPQPSPPPPPPSSSNLRFHPLFLGGAVLQMHTTTRVWGFATANDLTVSLYLDGTPVAKSPVVGSNYTWMVTIPPHSRGYNHHMRIESDSGGNTSTNVSFGHVILCSGTIVDPTLHCTSADLGQASPIWVCQ